MDVNEKADYLLAGVSGIEADRIGVAAAEAGHDLFRYNDTLAHAPREAIGHAYGQAAEMAIKSISEAHGISLEDIDDVSTEVAGSGNFLTLTMLTTDGRTLSAVGMIADPRRFH